MTLRLKPGTSWDDVYSAAHAAAPEAFDTDRTRNLICGEWFRVGLPAEHWSPVDGQPLPGPPQLSTTEAAEAVAHAEQEHQSWSRVPLQERKAKVTRAVADLQRHRDTLALLLVWEIGKPWRLACADVDRALDGVRWYARQIDGQMAGRRPLPGPVSNIASWNYPMSVQVHGELVQCLAGNAVIAKSPSQGGVHTLTLAHALMRRAGLPVSLLSGAGSVLGDVLTRSEEIGCLAFVGGRKSGQKVAKAISATGKRHFLEQEGLNTWGIWDFTQWDLLARHLRKGFEYAKQRCTAYPRYVVQRRLFPQFLATYTRVLDQVSFGHPLAVNSPDEPLPDLDFGPLIKSGKARELASQLADALAGGALPLYQGDLERGRFLAGQDTSAYFAPAAVLQPPTNWSLHHAEPFGPLDSIVVVDTEAELLAAMNASNGALVASLATDNIDLMESLPPELQAFKVGINEPRSRGDRAESFGGKGASWTGAFVGGDLLVQAVTQGPAGEQLFGNFPTYTRYPA